MRHCINDLSDRVGEGPQSLILSLTRSIAVWVRVVAVGELGNLGLVTSWDGPCRSGTLDPWLGAGYDRGASLLFGEVELMETSGWVCADARPLWLASLRRSGINGNRLHPDRMASD